MTGAIFFYISDVKVTFDAILSGINRPSAIFLHTTSFVYISEVKCRLGAIISGIIWSSAICVYIT